MSQRPPAEVDPEKWILDAEKKLGRAQAQFVAKDYGDAVSDLQGSEERTAKAIMLRLEILPSDPKLAAVVKKAFPGLKYRSPEALSHNWHEKMLEDLTPVLDQLQAYGDSYGNKPGGWRTTKFWRSAIPDYRERLAKARAVKAVPTPPLQELDDVLKDCNRMLDALAENMKKLNVRKIKIPKQRVLDRAVARKMRGTGQYMTREDRRALEEAAVTELKPLLDNFSVEFRRIVELTQILLTLAVLNVYLYKHHTTGSYPSSQYTDTFPMVVRFQDLASILHRILDRTKGFAPLAHSKGPRMPADARNGGAASE